MTDRTDAQTLRRLLRARSTGDHRALRTAADAITAAYADADADGDHGHMELAVLGRLRRLLLAAADDLPSPPPPLPVEQPLPADVPWVWITERFAVGDFGGRAGCRSCRGYADEALPDRRRVALHEADCPVGDETPPAEPKR